MITSSLLQTYQDQFDGLKRVVRISTTRLLDDPPDPIFDEHQNIFIKSYLVSACSILEAFIQEIASEYLNLLQNRLNSINLPHNLVSWISGNDKNKLEFKPFVGQKSNNDISSLVSPNFWKTKSAFERIGVDLSSSNVEQFKDQICVIVEKRNKIVHHNDSASDLSFADIEATIDLFKSYCETIYTIVSQDRHLQME